MKVFCTNAILQLKTGETFALVFSVPYSEEKPLADYYGEGLGKALRHIDTYYQKDLLRVNYNCSFTKNEA